MLTIISNRSVLFEKTRYEKEVIDGKETGRSVAIVEKKIQVAADSTRPQIVPDWVKQDPHFDMLVDDGQIIEVVATKGKQKQLNTTLKGATPEAETPKAQFADSVNTEGQEGQGEATTGIQTEQKAADATGWGATTQQ